jgi:uncharacterized repeat protein (TIGR03803 family)
MKATGSRARSVRQWTSRALMAAGLTAASLVAAATSTMSETTLFGFANTDGNAPSGQLIEASDGNYYGTTCRGGAAQGSDNGVIWKITPAGQRTLLHSFNSTNVNTGVNVDGACPGGVIQGADGQLYGVAEAGGSNAGGVVFKIKIDGSQFQVLHAFGNSHASDQTVALDGSIPRAALIPGADGNFYGSTLDGGLYNSGSLYRIAADGSGYQVLYSFGQTNNNAGSPIDGSGPLGSLVQANDGLFYGVTYAGGNLVGSEGNDLGSGGGTAFQFDAAQGTLVTLHSFKIFDTENGDGYEPRTNLAVGPDGAFYGATAYGGFGNADTDNGTLFRLNSAGGFQLLHDFTDPNSDGTPPAVFGITLGSDGNFYGTTRFTQQSGAGSIYQFTMSGDFSTLYTFQNADSVADGSTPNGPMVQTSDGSFIGSLLGDGPNANSSGGGAIFKASISPALAAPVQLTLTPSTLTVGQSPSQTATLSWQVLNATSETYSNCFASGAWTGPQAASGSNVVASSASGTAGTYRYALTCGGVESGSATLTILPAGAPTPAPTVAIAISPTSIALGNSATLTWSSTNATSCSASGAWSGSVGTSGSLSQHPNATGSSTYTLTCTGNGGSATQSATLTVTPVPVAPTVTIAVNPNAVTLGNSAALSWSSTDATACTASGAWSGSQAVSGSLGVQPTAVGHYTYTLTCTGDGGSAQAAATLTVNPQPVVVPLPTVSIAVAPASITLGNTANLQWSSTDAASCVASGAWSGNQMVSGSQVLEIGAAGSYTYVLTCTNASGSAHNSATLTVTPAATLPPPPPPAAPTLTFDLSPNSVTLGNSSTLSWSTSNATACTASDAWGGSQATQGSSVQAPQTAGVFDYTLTCNGAGGSISHSVTLTVNAVAGGNLKIPVKSGGGAFGLPALLGLLGMAGLRKRRWAASALASIGLAVIGTAQAEPEFTDHVYVGVRGGVMNLDVDTVAFKKDLAAAGYGNVSVQQSDDAAAGTIYLGYMVDPKLGFEAGYTHRDHTVLTIDGASQAQLQGLLDTAVDKLHVYSDIYSASIKFQQEILPRFSVTGRGGAFYWYEKTRARAGGLSASDTHQGAGMTVGAGLSYRIWRGLELGAGLDYFGGNSAELYAATLQWSFGR